MAVLEASLAPMEVGPGLRPRFLRAWASSTSLRDVIRMPHPRWPLHSPGETTLSAQRRQPRKSTAAGFRALGLAQLPGAAADLILHGDLTGRYASGCYSRLSAGARAVDARPVRQGASEHGHRVTSAIACYVARAGGTLGQLTQLLMRPDHEGGRHVRTIELRSGQARARDYLSRVWASASAAVQNTASIGSRQQVHEELAAVRAVIETTPWRGERGRTALRVLRAHLTFATIAGGRLHAASERQTAEYAGVSRQTLRRVYEAVLKPGGWLQRLRTGHGREGSIWYLGDGPRRGIEGLPSHSHTIQRPPDLALEEWSSPETDSGADIDSALIDHLMQLDAFARDGLGSSALMIIGALHARPAQTAGELVATSSVSRATTYRTLQRLLSHGLVQRTDRTWTLTPSALRDIGQPGNSLTTAVEPSQNWGEIAEQYGTQGTGARRKARHAAERAAYLLALEQGAERRSAAHVILRDGQAILVPALRGDEVPPAWHAPGGGVLDPCTGRPAPDWHVATDGRLILVTPADQRSYDDLVKAHAEALHDWECTV